MPKPIYPCFDGLPKHRSSLCRCYQGKRKLAGAVAWWVTFDLDDAESDTIDPEKTNSAFHQLFETLGELFDGQEVAP